MKRRTSGWLVGLVLLGSPLAWAQAGGDSGRGSPVLASDAEGSPGPRGTLEGTVLGAGPGTLFVTGPSGASVPLRVTHRTRISGDTVPRDQEVESFLREHLKPGTTVRARFDVRALTDGTPENVASTVDPTRE